jgi:hypothetical protein
MDPISIRFAVSPKSNTTVVELPFGSRTFSGQSQGIITILQLIIGINKQGEME